MVTPTEPVPSASSENRPIVTVVVITFNHERYIEQAVLSVLSQKLEEHFEILVGDDCSTDRTRELLRKLSDAHPGRLRLIFRDTNIGLSSNLQDCREKARGKYMAILEGDDYWTDDRKLRKLIDAMEANDDWSMCFHACQVKHLDVEGHDFIAPLKPPERPLVVTDMLRENRVHTMTVTMYRQGVIRQTPDWHRQLRNGDWALYVMHADRGPIGFVPDVMAVYRVHSRGFWSGWNTFDRWLQTLTLFDCLERYLEGRYGTEVRAARENLLSILRQRVADLERIERRYFALRLDRFAAICKWFRDTWQSVFRTTEKRP